MTKSFKVVIPARIGSTRLPNKPLLDLGGKPMVVRVAERALRSTAECVVVATDSDEIIATCERHGIVAVPTDTTHQSGTDRVAEACEKLGWDDQEIVINLQGDEPLIDPHWLLDCAKALQPNVSMATLAAPISNSADFHDPNVVKVVLNAKNHALTFSRAPIPWNRKRFHDAAVELPCVPALHHLGVYAMRVSFLKSYVRLPISPLERCESLEQLRALYHGHTIAVHICKEGPPIGVDTMADYNRVRDLFLSNTT